MWRVDTGLSRPLKGAAGFMLAVAVLVGGTVYGAADEKIVPQSREELNLSYAPVVKHVSPAVVNVYARRVVAQRAMPFDDPLFREFFGGMGGFPPRQRVQQSLGSGVILDPSGLILTNNHVIAGMTDVRVSLADQREFDVDVVLTDPTSDLAVLRIRTKGQTFPTLTLGDADSLEVGDLVLAVGNPFGLGQTVTQGILSAVRRVQIKEGEERVYLQTDAAINQGNSGGALVNMKGELVGINTAIFSRSGGSDGIGFAIPSSIVRLVLDAARRGDKLVRKPWLGAKLQAVTPEIAESLHRDRPIGALVSDVTKESPAAKGGLEPGDLVVAIDGMPVDDPADLTYHFITRSPGSTVHMRVIRNGSETELSVVAATAPETVPRDEKTLGGNGPLAGAKVANLSPAVADELGMEMPTGGGVVIVAADDATVASRIGFRKRDRIVSVNGTQIDDVATLVRATEQQNHVWKITIDRSGQRMTQIFQF